MILLIVSGYYLLTSVLKCVNREYIGGKYQYLPQNGSLHSLHFIRCIVPKYQYLPWGRYILPDDSYSQTPKRLSLNIYTKKQCHIRPVNAIVLYKSICTKKYGCQSKQVLWAASQDNHKINIWFGLDVLTHLLILCLWHNLACCYNAQLLYIFFGYIHSNS